MAWTVPRTWVAGELVTAAIMNTHIRDNFNVLREREVWFSAQAGNLSTGSGTHRAYAYEDRSITTCIFFVDTAPVGSDAEFDIHKGGTTIYTTQANRPIIAASAFVSSEIAPDIQAWAADAYLQADVDAVGSSTEGADATGVVIYTKD